MWDEVPNIRDKIYSTQGRDSDDEILIESIRIGQAMIEVNLRIEYAEVPGNFKHKSKDVLRFMLILSGYALEISRIEGNSCSYNLKLSNGKLCIVLGDFVYSIVFDSIHAVDFKVQNLTEVQKSNWTRVN